MKANKANKTVKSVFGKYQTGGKTDDKKKEEKKRKEEVFQRDSTNLENATDRYMKALEGKGGVADWVQGEDSLKTISKRREGDTEFWNRMNPKKKEKGGKVDGGRDKTQVKKPVIKTIDKEAAIKKFKAQEDNRNLEKAYLILKRRDVSVNPKEEAAALDTVRNIYKRNNEEDITTSKYNSEFSITPKKAKGGKVEAGCGKCGMRKCKCGGKAKMAKGGKTKKC